MTPREQVGVIGVDAGLCWVGDPCYMIDCEREGLPPRPATSRKVFRNWDAFLKILWGDGRTPAPQTRQFNYPAGHPGLGVCVSSGHGDGVYPVYVTRTKDGSIASVTVEFIPEGEE